MYLSDTSAETKLLNSIKQKLIPTMSIFSGAIVIFLFIGAVLSSIGLSYAFPEPIKCQESDRNHRVCATFMYLPALGHTQDNRYKVYPSGCDACRDPKIDIYWNFQMCPVNSAVTPSNSRFPVCLLAKENKLQQYSSDEDACNSGDARFFLPGPCPDIP